MRSVAIGVFTTFLCMVMSGFVVGPLLRLMLGPPAFFRTDATTREAYLQGMISHSVCLVVLFFVVGYLGFGGRWTRMLLIINPITLGVGCYGFSYVALNALSFFDDGYAGPSVCLRVILIGSFVGLPAIAFGTCARER